MNNKLIFIFIVMLTLSSCKLAKEEVNVSNDDSIIGMYLTSEPINSEDKIYAELVTTTDGYTDSAGNTLETNKYVFKGLDGIPLFLPTQTIDGNDTIVNSTDGVSNVNILAGDNEGVSGTLYANPKTENFTLYSYTVYQTSTGEIYLMTDEPHNISTNYQEGASISSKVEENKKVTIDGETKQRNFKAEITVEFRKPSETIEVVEFDKDNYLVIDTSYNVEVIPDKIELQKETAFVVINFDNSDKSEIYNKGSETQSQGFTFYRQTDSELLEPIYIEFIW